ncbi:MAG: hypothetical protein GQ529_12850 [Methyloprofundus sp.]|nr:hypothetical protein [Methyloprofundus sp.]
MFRSEDLIKSESIAQDFGFTVVLGKQAHSKLRNYFSSAAVESKDKLDSGIIEFSFLSQDIRYRHQKKTIGKDKTFILCSNHPFMDY